jgi:N-methylhydantoinase B
LTAGGGGHGDPDERDPAAIQRDLDKGYNSAETARDDYGFAG